MEETPSSNRKLRFTAEWMNWGEVGFSNDELVSKTYQFFDDLSVDIAVRYSKSGVVSVRQIFISQTEIDELLDLLNGDFLTCEDNKAGCDGEGWTFVLYSEKGEIIHSFTGYICGIYYLTDIANYVKLITKSLDIPLYGNKSMFNLFK